MLFPFIQYQFLNYIKSFRFIPPVTVYLGWIVILYAYKNVPILSSYAVSSLALLLVMTWVTMSFMPLENGNEKYILLANLRSKGIFLLGKWVSCAIILIFLLLFALLFPIVTNSFKGEITALQLVLAVYGHLLLGGMGMLVGTFFSVTNFVKKSSAWLASIFVLVISIAKVAIVETVPLLKWVLVIFPPVPTILERLNRGDHATIGQDFYLELLLVVLYILVVIIVNWRLFMRRED